MVQNSTILIMCDTYPLLLWKIKSKKQRSHTKDDDDDVKQNRKIPPQKKLFSCDIKAQFFLKNFTLERVFQN